MFPISVARRDAVQQRESLASLPRCLSRQRANIRPIRREKHIGTIPERNVDSLSVRETTEICPRSLSHTISPRVSFLDPFPFPPPLLLFANCIRSRSRKRRRLSETSSDSETVIPFVFPNDDDDEEETKQRAYPEHHMTRSSRHRPLSPFSAAGRVTKRVVVPCARSLAGPSSRRGRRLGLSYI